MPVVLEGALNYGTQNSDRHYINIRDLCSNEGIATRASIRKVCPDTHEVRLWGRHPPVTS